MLNYARSLCIIYQKNCDGCPIKKVCKRKIMLSREEVENWINDLELMAQKIIKGDLNHE